MKTAVQYMYTMANVLLLCFLYAFLSHVMYQLEFQDSSDRYTTPEENGKILVYYICGMFDINILQGSMVKHSKVSWDL